MQYLFVLCGQIPKFVPAESAEVSENEGECEREAATPIDVYLKRFSKVLGAFLIHPANLTSERCPLSWVVATLATQVNLTALRVKRSPGRGPAVSAHGRSLP